MVYLHLILDYTAATILESFQNEATAVSVERVLKKLSGEKAATIMAVCYDLITQCYCSPTS